MNMKKKLVAAISPKVIVGSPIKNGIIIKLLLEEVARKDVYIAVLPRFCLTSIAFDGVSVDDDILKEQDEAIDILCKTSKDMKIDVVFSYICKSDLLLYERYVIIKNGKLKSIDDVDLDILPYPSDIKENIYVDNIINNILNATKKMPPLIVASPSYTESTDKYVYGNRSFISKNGKILKLMNINEDYIIADIDSKNYIDAPNYDINKYPKESNEHILYILAIALYKRYIATKSKTLVLGLSGGVDSTIALLVCDKMRDMFNIDKNNFIIVTMPAFATSDRSYNNALNLADALDFNIRNINITNTIKNHFIDISHDENNTNVTYENAQARIRTLTLFDIANDENGIVIGTGDMSEIALGWSTYGGDQLSNYNLNMNLPKTLIKKILKIKADTTDNKNLSKILYDIIDMPISPELKINQKTEDLLGPYEIIDYIMIHYLSSHKKKDELINDAIRFFADKYDKNLIIKTADIFFNRYYKNEFKRKASASGPNIGYPEFDILPTDIER